MATNEQFDFTVSTQNSRDIWKGFLMIITRMIKRSSNADASCY